jgi:ParB-like nuclease family protein
MAARTNKNYVPCPDYWDTSSCLQDHPDIFQLVRRLPVKEIKYNKARFPNRLDSIQVKEIVQGFYPDAWEPLWIDPQNNLTDGQHRFHAAKEMGIRFVDVIVYNEELNERKGKARNESRKKDFI